MQRIAYYSHSTDAGNTLAVWLDERPSCSKEQRDPDGWISGVTGTEYEADRLAELARAPGCKLVRLHGAAAEWWHRIETGRRRAASKERNAKHKDAQVAFLIPPEIEAEGRDVGYQRTAMKARARR